MGKGCGLRRVALTSQFLLYWAVLFVLNLGAQERLREPLPIETAVSVNNHSGRSAFDLSPDGQWLAHTWSGDSFANGNARSQAALTNVKTGEVIRLGGPTRSNWAPVWSPDGNRVAYYS